MAARRRQDKKKSGQFGTFNRLELRAKILDALNDQKYIARTVDGIAKEAHVPAKQIVETIVGDNDLRMIVKVYPRRTAKGKLLLTTKERFRKKASWKDKFIDVFSTTQVNLEDAG